MTREIVRRASRKKMIRVQTKWQNQGRQKKVKAGRKSKNEKRGEKDYLQSGKRNEHDIANK